MVERVRKAGFHPDTGEPLWALIDECPEDARGSPKQQHPAYIARLLPLSVGDEIVPALFTAQGLKEIEGNV